MQCSWYSPSYLIVVFLSYVMITAVCVCMTGECVSSFLSQCKFPALFFTQFTFLFGNKLKSVSVMLIRDDLLCTINLMSVTCGLHNSNKDAFFLLHFYLQFLKFRLCYYKTYLTHFSVWSTAVSEIKLR